MQVGSYRAMARIIGRISAILVLIAFGTWGAWAAPSDDGQTAGSRAWVLFSMRSVVAVTPSDGADLAIVPTRGIIGWITAASTCNIALRGVDNGTTAVTVPVAVGVVMWIEVSRILATGTTCTTVVALY
jgi:hypothetical protein